MSMKVPGLSLAWPDLIFSAGCCISALPISEKGLVWFV